MRARSLECDPFVAARRLVESDLVGIGEPLSQSPGSAEDAIFLTSHEHGEKAARMLERFVCLPNQTLLWTRIDEDAFVLGQITGPWRYEIAGEGVFDGITNVRPARWVDEAFPKETAPTGVVETFNRGGRNMQAIRDRTTTEESRSLWDGG
jgi:hypothetical protein